MKTLLLRFPVAFLLVVAGCADGTLSYEEGDEAYDVVIRFSDDHVATLESFDVEVFISDHDGQAVTSIPSVAVEFRQEGTADWNIIEMAVHDDHYVGEHRFMTSGEYQFRVVGIVDDHADHRDVLFEMNGHLEVERTHMEMDGIRVSYESFPGDVHEGDEADIRFWIEEMGGGHGASHMLSGLGATIACLESDGSTERHAAVEHESGVYGTRHTFTVEGDAEVTLHFEQRGMMRDASFIFPVAGGH